MAPASSMMSDGLSETGEISPVSLGNIIPYCTPICTIFSRSFLFSQPKRLPVNRSQKVFDHIIKVAKRKFFPIAQFHQVFQTGFFGCNILSLFELMTFPVSAIPYRFDGNSLCHKLCYAVFYSIFDFFWLLLSFAPHEVYFSPALTSNISCFFKDWKQYLRSIPLTLFTSLPEAIISFPFRTCFCNDAQFLSVKNHLLYTLMKNLCCFWSKLNLPVEYCLLFSFFI